MRWLSLSGRVRSGFDIVIVKMGILSARYYTYKSGHNPIWIRTRSSPPFRLLEMEMLFQVNDGR